MKRREFIALFGSAALFLPIAARAQQAGTMRRIGLLQGLVASDPDWQRRLAAFRQALQGFGWVEGRNITIEFRYADGKPERLAALANELVQARVELIVTNAAQPIEAAHGRHHDRYGACRLAGGLDGLRGVGDD